MPNPNPVKRPPKPRPAGQAEELPPGFSRRKNGGLHYKWTEPSGRKDAYGKTVEACYAKRFTTKPAPSKVDERTTLAEYLGLWQKGLAIRPNSKDVHRYNIEQYLVPVFGTKVRLADIDREFVEAKMADLRAMETRGGQPIAPRTVALAFGTLRACLQYATDHGRVKYNPCLRLNPNGSTGAAARSRRVGVELAIPSELEIRRVLKATSGDGWRPLLAVAAATGLRQSELLGLGDDDVDLDGHWLRVSRSLRRFDRVLDDTKTDESARFVPIPPALVAIFETQRLERDRLAFLAGDRWHNPHRFVFTGPTGGPLIGSTLSHWFADACTEAGVPRFRWHDLRHYYASTLINRGISIAVVSKLLGHSNVTITSETYHHLLKSDDLGTAAVAGQVLEGLA